MFTKLRSKLLATAVSLIGRTIRLANDPMIEVSRLKSSGKNLIFALWHESTFYCFYFYRLKNAGIFVDDSENGRILAGMARSLGFKTFAVSNDLNDRQTTRGTIQLIKYLREGHDGVVAIDGPKGPYHEAKPGILTIAEKANALIVPITVTYKHKITLFWRWDKYQLPVPFTKGSITLGTAVEAKKNKSKDEAPQDIEAIIPDILPLG